MRKMVNIGVPPVPVRLAFSSGNTIIPYENVLAVQETSGYSEYINIILDSSTRSPCIIELRDDVAKEFVSKYNFYLHMIETEIAKGEPDE